MRNMALNLYLQIFVLKFLPSVAETPCSLLPNLASRTTRRHSATRKHVFVYPQGDRLGLRKPKKR